MSTVSERAKRATQPLVHAAPGRGRKRTRDLTDEENESARRYAKKLLVECDENVSELARRLGLASSGVGRFLSGAQGTSRHTAERIAKHLGLDVEEVLGHVAKEPSVYPVRVAEPATPQKCTTTTTTSEHLNWGDTEAVRRWFLEMRVALEDADSVVRDALRPIGRRELGRVLHLTNYGDAHTRIVNLVAHAEPSPHPVVSGSRGSESSR